MKLVLLGPSGAGKGTQAKNLAKHFNIVHISTGDILRDHMKRKTAIGIEIEHIMDKGSLVSDEIVTPLVKDRVLMDDCKRGFILDGYPRNLKQAEMLETIVGKLHAVVAINLADEVIVKRMSGRFSCPHCGAVYHKEFYPPKKIGVCDVCNTDLIQREDDKEETVIHRLKIYHEMTEPIKDYFRKLNLLVDVDGFGTAEEITASIIRSLEV